MSPGPTCPAHKRTSFYGRFPGLVLGTKFQAGDLPHFLPLALTEESGMGDRVRPQCDSSWCSLSGASSYLPSLLGRQRGQVERTWALEPDTLGLDGSSVLLDKLPNLSELQCPVCLSNGNASLIQCEGRAMTGCSQLHLVSAL